MVDAVVTNSLTIAQDLYHDKKIKTIDALVIQNIYKMLEEVGLGAYRPKKK